MSVTGYQQRGTATIEAAILLPLMIWLILAVTQLIWIFWAQHILHNTGHYVLRAGQLQHGELRTMHNVLATGMASTQLQAPRAKPDANDSDKETAMRTAAWRATTAALVHGRLASTIVIHSPTPALQQQASERRYDLRSADWVQEIPIDHALARTHSLEDPTTWLAARQLDIEIWWCMPLQVPLVAPVLQSWWQLLESPAQRFCRLRQAVVGKPLWPLVTRRKGPMQS